MVRAAPIVHELAYIPPPPRYLRFCKHFEGRRVLLPTAFGEGEEYAGVFAGYAFGGEGAADHGHEGAVEGQPLAAAARRRLGSRVLALWGYWCSAGSLTGVQRGD